MTAAPADLRAWSRRRWWVGILLLLVSQMGLVFWLGDRSLPAPREVAAKPAVVLAPGLSGELLSLIDPTLFAWGNRLGFSGAAWLKIPPVNYQLADWREPPRFLPLPIEELGNIFHRFDQTNLITAFQVAGKLEPRFSLADISLPGTSLSVRSSLRMEGGLAARSLLSAPELPSRTNTDVLASSVVKVMVDGDGQTISATLISGSGNREADRSALSFASLARFNSLHVSGPDRLMESPVPVTWGNLIFDWHTAPMPPTNAPPPSR